MLVLKTPQVGHVAEFVSVHVQWYYVQLRNIACVFSAEYLSDVVCDAFT